MDRLDRFSIWAIVLLIIGSSALISHHLGEARPEKGLRERTSSPSVPANDTEFEGRLRTAKRLMEGEGMQKAEGLVKELIEKYPYEGEPRMLMGDIFMRMQKPVRAVLEYKEAVDLNPDYLDRKTPLFQGRKMKVAVVEALTEIGKRQKAQPEDESLRRDRKALYYLQRRIAGSCG